MAQHNFGSFGWFSLAGFVILGLLWILGVTNVATWPVGLTLTLVLAIVAGLGAVLLYFGDDPTAPETPREA